MTAEVKEIKRLSSLFDKQAKKGVEEGSINGYILDDDPERSDTLFDSIEQEIIGLLDLKDHHTIMDIGTGSGELLRRLSSYTQHACGVDISPKMVELARSKGLSVEHFDGINLPYRDESVDRGVIFSVLLNFGDITYAKNLLLSSLKALKPGGMFLVGNNSHPTFGPHPLASTRKSPRKAVTDRVRGALGRPSPHIGCYSYPISFFSDIFNEIHARELLIRMSQLEHPGWNYKYHAVIVK